MLRLHSDFASSRGHFPALRGYARSLSRATRVRAAAFPRSHHAPMLRMTPRYHCCIPRTWPFINDVHAPPLDPAALLNFAMLFPDASSHHNHSYGIAFACHCRIIARIAFSSLRVAPSRIAPHLAYLVRKCMRRHCTASAPSISH